jgi:hypothetical protein
MRSLRLRMSAERRDQRRHVEEVAQALAVGLEQHRKRSVARRDRQQIGGALALLPQRRALPARRWQQQRAGGVLAELRGEQRGRAELADDERLDVVGIRQQQLRIRRLIHVRKPHHEPVVSPQRLDFGAGLLADLRRHRHRPRRVDAPPAATARRAASRRARRARAR